jgi:hypothetical protein
MVPGSPVILMYLAMLLMSRGISSALVAPPLVIGQAMGAREFAKSFSLAIAFLYAGNALGGPNLGTVGPSGNTKLGMYFAPVLIALFLPPHRSRRGAARRSTCGWLKPRRRHKWSRRRPQHDRRADASGLSFVGVETSTAQRSRGNSAASTNILSGT